MTAQRLRILRATIECIAEKGVEGTSIASICKRADLSAGALYVHFRNKGEILTETVRYGSAQIPNFPDDWPSFKAMIVSFEDQFGFDIVTVVRTRLHFNAEFVRSGRLHDMGRPLLQKKLSMLAAHLQKMHNNGDVQLKFSAEQTAVSIAAFIDGMLWIALAGDRPLDDVRAEMSAGLDCFVKSVHDPPVGVTGSESRASAETMQDRGR